MLAEFFNKIISPKIDSTYLKFNTRPEAKSTIASVSVLFISDAGETVISVYDNTHRLSECKVQVTLDPTHKDYAKDLGEAIIEAVNQLT